MSWIWISWVALGATGTSSAAVSGQAKVISADTLEVAGTKFKLTGIDAPSVLQGCKDGHGRFYRCGLEAWKFTNSLVSRKSVSCAAVKEENWGSLAHCTVNGEDIAIEIVRKGHAVVLPSGQKYAAAEAAARSEKRGLWAGPFLRPDQWRLKMTTVPVVATERILGSK